MSKHPWRKIKRPEGAWSWKQAEIFVADTKRPWSIGWHSLGPDLQEALIRSRVLYIIQTQHCDSLELTYIRSLTRQMMIVAGLEPMPADGEELL